MTRLRAWLGGAALLLPGLVLGAAGIVFFQDGVALDAAYPVPLFLSTNSPMPPAAYQVGAKILDSANHRNGEAQISLAEARYYDAKQGSEIFGPLRAGLAHAPASAEGWAFYAERLASKDPRNAARALGQSLTLAPYEYFWMVRRAHLSAILWDFLDSDTKANALRQARAIWEQPGLRDGLLYLLSDPKGVSLVTRAYAGEPDTLRALNRWVSARNRELRRKS